MVYLLFFLSGLSGLIYQVVWVRVFGNVFGNTIHSASLVIAVFMLGLGAGSYFIGAWSDRRYLALVRRGGPPERTAQPALASRVAQRPDSGGGGQSESLLRAYGRIELVIAAMGFAISLLLPQLDQLSAPVTSYVRDPNGWYVLSMTSYVARVVIAVLLLTPITLLMGGTLTLLIRHLVRSDLDIAGWRIAVLYAVNTVGAAVGCFLTDFTLVPAAGLLRTQMVAVSFNVVAGVGALYLASGSRVRLSASAKASADKKPDTTTDKSRKRRAPLYGAPGALVFTSLALGLMGFAAMGMEIVWFRHFTILLGGFRAVFSLLLSIILIGIGVGSFISGIVHRRSQRPAESLMLIQGLFVALALLGLALADANSILREVQTDPAYLATAGRVPESLPTGWARTLTELWFNARPILLEVAVPALLMGFSFPLANAIIQRAERSVGRRAGVLYLANTAGAVCGSLAAGFLLLPKVGIQTSASVLMGTAALAVVPLYLATRTVRLKPDTTYVLSRLATARVALASSLLIAGVALGWWFMLPSDYVITRALRPAPNERVLTVSDGLTEVISVTEVPGKGRTLVTNGHPMSSTRRLSQRYMRALAHIPLLSMDDPQTVLVIGFGVGNTTHAAALHPSIRRVEVADLSKDILSHARYFADVNQDVLHDPQVAVYVNDGRHHLHMRPPASYDLITLEPPPIGYAGVAALYSNEFYELARTRLEPGGHLSQWLPAYQVPGSTTLAMIRAFVDVFPQALLLSGAEADLLLIGANDSRIELDPERLAARLARAPKVHADLARLDLGSVREIAGAFVGSAQMLSEASRDAKPVSDDYPIQEYGVQSLLNFGEAVPASVVDLSQLAAWCPKCFVDGRPSPVVEGLDTYLALLDLAYTASPAEMARTRRLAEESVRVIAGSAYLGAIVPESADLHNVLGISLAATGRLDEAILEFRHALRLEPDLAETHWHLGAALAQRGLREEAIAHLRRSVELDPANVQARSDLEVVLRES